MLVALLLMSYRCIVTVNALWLFLTVPWVGLQCVSVVFPEHTHLLFSLRTQNYIHKRIMIQNPVWLPSIAFI